MRHDRIDSKKEFTDASGKNKLTVVKLYRKEDPSPSAKRQNSIEYFGECEAADGEIVQRRKRYPVNEKQAAEIVQALEEFHPYQQERRPQSVSEHSIETSLLTVSLKNTPEGSFVVLAHLGDGWRFESPVDDRLGDAIFEIAS